MQGAGRFHLVRGNMEVRDNDNLTNFGDLRLDSILGNFIVAENPGLQDLLGLDSLRYIGGTFNVIGNFSIDDLAGLDSLQTIGGDLNIQSNTSMERMSGLVALDSILGNFTLTNNSSLIDVLGLDSLNFILGDYNVAENPNLMSLPLTIALDSIGALNISGNGSLINLTGLESVRSIRGLVQIINNENLTSLDGLDSLTALRGTLRMFNNVMLSDISSLANVDPQTITDVAIENCESLSACAIESLCHFLAGGGPSSISNNAIGCNSADEVLLTCFVAVGEPEDENGIILYPNPTTGMLEINGLTTAEAELTITDVYGHIISRHGTSPTSLDLTYLPDGMYFICLVLDTKIVVRRITKTK